MPKMIVSANYRDRQSPIKWLMRQQDQDPNRAQPVKSIYATGVQFEPSSEWEAGFGCGVVASCETAVADASVPAGMNGIPIHFSRNDDQFYTEGGRLVSKCDHLILNPDGSMYMATNPATPKAPESADPKKELVPA